jgi:two-component system cell cycle sensor histidine kinase/response regulator CckA
VYLDLIHNVSALTTLVVLQSMAIRRLRSGSFEYKAVSGFLFGLVAVFLMMTPLHLMPGIIFDCRSIALSVAGFFGGPVVAGIAFVMSVTYRLWLGGVAWLVGTATIISSTSLGILFYYLRARHPVVVKPAMLFAFGVLVHVVMLSLMLCLPSHVRYNVIEKMAASILLIYAPATWLVCQLLLDEEWRKQMEASLKANERTFKSLFLGAPQAIFVQVDGLFALLNPRVLELFGALSEAQLKGEPVLDRFHPNYREALKERFSAAVEKEEHVSYMEAIGVRFDGSFFHAELSAVPLRYADSDAVLIFLNDVTDRKAALKLLLETGERLQLAIEATNIAIWDWNLISGEVFRSENFYSMLGYPQSAEHVSGDWLDLLIPDDRQEVERLFQQYSRGERASHELEFRIKRESGEEAWILSRGKVVAYDEENQPIRVAGTLSDITERKKAEDRLRNNAIFLNLVVENIPNMIFVKDASNLRFVRVNKAGEELLGYSRFELIGKNDYDIFPKDQADFFTAKDRAALDSGGLVDIPAERIDTRCKGQRILHTKKIPVKNPNGAPLYLLSISEDITEEVYLKQSLTQAEENYKLLVNEAPVGIAVFQKGKLIAVNPEFLRIFEYDTVQEVIGRNPADFVVAEERDILTAALRDCIRADRPMSRLEIRGLKKTGTCFDFGVRLRRIEYAGDLAILAFCMDRTEETLLREQLIQAQKIEAVGALAGGMAHDFNNLLQVILGYSDALLMKPDLDKRVQDSVKTIAKTAKHGADLVRRLLTFSRKAPSEMHPVDLNQEVEQAVLLLRRMFPQVISIELALEKELPPINADPRQIEQIIMNLAVNARDAMPVEGGRLTISTKAVQLDENYCALHPGSKTGLHVELVVADTGCGMTRETISHIFEPFFSTKGEGKGTGLGLAMVYNIVQQHQGHILCESEVGKGTTFSIYFPATHGFVSVASEEQASPVPTGSETILLVDDDETIRALCSDALKMAGYTVYEAKNGTDALKTYAEKKDEISLVILDGVMPDISGAQCLKALTRIDPQVRIILSTGLSLEEITRDGAEDRVKGFLQKPYVVGDLLRTVRRVLDCA